MGANPHTVGGRRARAAEAARLGQARGRARRAGQRAGERDERARRATSPTSSSPTRTRRTSASSAPTRSPRTGSTRSSRSRTTRYVWPLDPEIDTGHRRDGRIMEMLSEHNCQGWMQGYVLTGRHCVFPCYEAFIPIVDGMVNQYGKFLTMSRNEAPWRAPVCGPELPADLRRLAPGPQRLLAPDAGLHQLHAQPQGGAAPHLPARRREHAAGDDGQVPALDRRDQPGHRLQAPAAPVAVASTRPRSTSRAARRSGTGPPTTTASPTSCSPPAATIPTVELLAAASLLRDAGARSCACASSTSTTSTRWRPRAHHPSGLSQSQFTQIFTKDRPVLFNFHGYPSAIHQLIHRRPQQARFHVRGLHRGGHDHHPVRPAGDERRRPLPARDRGADPRRHPRRRDAPGHVRRVRDPRGRRTPRARSTSFRSKLERLRAEIREIGDDPPEITEWVWSASDGRDRARGRPVM